MMGVIQVREALPLILGASSSGFIPGADSGPGAYPPRSGVLLLDECGGGSAPDEEKIMKFFRSGSYASVASTAALVVALGGTSYAAAQITGSDIKHGTVGKSALAKSAQVTAKSVHNDNSTAMTGSTKTVLSLNVPKGRYVVSSKATAFGTGNNSYTGCYLYGPAGSVRDFSEWWAGSAVTGYGTLVNQAVIKAGSAGTIQLRCYGGSADLAYKKLTAVRVAGFTDLTGPDVAKSVQRPSLRPTR